MSAALQLRLRRLLRDGNLTVADLARWLERPHPTVRGWALGGNLGGAPMDVKRVLARVKLLESLLARRRRLPVPQLSARQRIAYIKNMMIEEIGE